jgi:hypothetical protein
MLQLHLSPRSRAHEILSRGIAATNRNLSLPLQVSNEELKDE